MNGAFRIAKLDFFTMKSQAVLYAIMVLICHVFYYGLVNNCIIHYGGMVYGVNGF